MNTNEKSSNALYSFGFTWVHLVTLGCTFSFGFTCVHLFPFGYTVNDPTNSRTPELPTPRTPELDCRDVLILHRQNLVHLLVVTICYFLNFSFA